MQDICMPQMFINWVMVVVTNVNYEFNINGNTFEIMHGKKGLRQGDHISPFLFVLMMEYFNRLLVKMHNDPAFNFHVKCEKVGIPNLTFADDILLFYRGDVTSFQMILNNVNGFLLLHGW